MDEPNIPNPPNGQELPPHKYWLGNHTRGTITAAVLILLAASAIAYWQLPEKQAEEVKKDNTPAVTETSDWKTYTNTQYGFEFRYPKEWSVKEKTYPVVSITYPDKNIAINIEPTNVGRESVFDSSADPRCEIKNIQFGGRNAKECVAVSQNTIERYLRIVKTDGINWQADNEIWYVFNDQEISNVSVVDLNQILSTFKFINPDEASWKTYRNTEHGFEIQYPSEWEVIKAERHYIFRKTDTKYMLEGPGSMEMGISVFEYKPSVNNPNSRLVEKNGLYYVFEKDLISISIYDQITSTIKFIN